MSSPNAGATHSEESLKKISVKDAEQTLFFPPSPPVSISSSEDEDVDPIHSSFSAFSTMDTTIGFPLPPVSTLPSKVLDIDANTPDNHVPRDSRLIRLTGVHPYNVEAPLTTLFQQGFLTPPSLSYVRNHGPVPKVLDEEIPDWTISVEGLVENPIQLSFREILEEFEQITLPVTMVCAGNRRKEQNLVRKSQGFSWGAAGISTSLYTGPLLADIVRVAKPKRGAKYVCMEGADKLPNGYYGTSVRLSWVMQYERGIMLAHKMNGEPLTPDHGRPIRVVIPGQIGGRSVKWLKRLIITDKPSDNWYHKFDNRVLPTMVTPEMSKADQKWWNDERYAIYDLSVNSVIACPAHNETLELRTAEREYELRGYAYTGGMRRITRVELSLDKGKTWSLADIDYPEDLYRSNEQELFGGRLDMMGRDGCYCWCFWNLKISIDAFANADDIVLRAMDDSMTVQPRDMYWSVLGMMHNAWFRVSIRKDAEGVLRFEHPAPPRLNDKGWMERVKKEGGEPTSANWGEKTASSLSKNVSERAVVKEVKMTNDKITKEVGYEELKARDKATGPWFVVNGEVYDGTEFLKDHPGGAQSIISAGGLDASEEFLAIHSESAKAMMPDYHIGTLSRAARKRLTDTQQDGIPDIDRPIFLNPRLWTKSTLVSKKKVSWDTRIFTFKLDRENQVLGLPIGQHLMIRLKDDKTGDVVIRAYTPISNNDRNGFVDLLVKVYFDSDSAPGGKMTIALDKLPLGEDIEFKGPIGKLEYLGKGMVRLLGKERKVNSFYMICAGSGITPIYQVLRAVMEDPEDSTTCVVLDGNRLEEDILCREELDKYQRENKRRLKLIHTLSKPDKSWTGRRGRIDTQLLKQELPEGGRLVLVCGPEAMEKSVRRALKELGLDDDDIVFF